MAVALVVRWSGIRTGREREALDVISRIDQVWGRYAAEGKCDEPTLLLDPATMGGVWSVTGNPEVLGALATGKESVHLGQLSSLVAEDFHAQMFMFTDDDARKCLEMWGGAAAELGFVPASTPA